MADSVPEEEIGKIPPSSSVYNVTHVHVYESTPEVVYVGYTPGYLWSFPYYGVPVYGTGWYYPRYPGYYYPRPVTFGFHVGYNPWTGWSFGMSWNVGFLHFGVSWGGGYRGPWGGYGGCCGGWYGGYRPGWGGGYHGGHNTINIGSINIGNNIKYGNRQRVTNNLRANPNAARLRQPSVYSRPEVQARNADRAAVQRSVQEARAARGTRNDVLVDRNGNVARTTPQGLEERAAGRWQNVDRDAARQKAQSVDRSAAQDRARSVDRSSVQRDYQSRQRGAQRERTQSAVPRSRPMPRPGGARRR